MKVSVKQKPVIHLELSEEQARVLFEMAWHNGSLPGIVSGRGKVDIKQVKDLLDDLRGSLREAVECIE